VLFGYSRDNDKKSNKFHSIESHETPWENGNLGLEQWPPNPIHPCRFRHLWRIATFVINQIYGKNTWKDKIWFNKTALRREILSNTPIPFH